MWKEKQNIRETSATCRDSRAQGSSSRQVARTDQKSSAQQPRGVGSILSTSINTHLEKIKKNISEEVLTSKCEICHSQFDKFSPSQWMTQSAVSFFVLFLHVGRLGGAKLQHTSRRRHRRSNPAHILLAFQVRYEFQPTATIWTTARLQQEQQGWKTSGRTNSLWARLKLDGPGPQEKRKKSHSKFFFKFPFQE